LLLIGAAAHSQTTQIEFDYDDAGNRTSRQIVTLNKSAFLSDTISISEAQIGNRSLKLFPNPTYGVLTMSVDNLDAGEIINVLVTDIAGHTIIKDRQQSSSFKIDLSDYPKGVYIFSATIGKQRKEWKIVKK
jgi:hypothetical protein